MSSSISNKFVNFAFRDFYIKVSTIYKNIYLKDVFMHRRETGSKISGPNFTQTIRDPSSLGSNVFLKMVLHFWLDKGILIRVL